VQYCDFCSREVTGEGWEYPAKDVAVQFDGPLLGVIPMGALLLLQGGWLACPSCHPVIQTGDRRAVAEASLRGEGCDVTPESVERMLKVQSAFFDYRTGDPVYTNNSVTVH
jgi:hypothetical protein